MLNEWLSPAQDPTEHENAPTNTMAHYEDAIQIWIGINMALTSVAASGAECMRGGGGRAVSVFSRAGDTNEQTGRRKMKVK